MDFGGQCQSYDVEKHYFPAIEDLAINFIILFLKVFFSITLTLFFADLIFGMFAPPLSQYFIITLTILS